MNADEEEPNAIHLLRFDNPRVVGRDKSIQVRDPYVIRDGGGRGSVPCPSKFRRG